MEILHVSYALPVIDHIEPLIESLDPNTDYTTEGGILMRVFGRNFGPVTENLQVSFDGVLSGCEHPADGYCPVVKSRTQSSILFRTPAGAGRNIPLEVMVDGGRSNTFGFHYSPPFITKLKSTQTEEGYAKLSLRGRNFGTTSLIQLGTTSGEPCSVVDKNQTHVSMSILVACQSAEINVVVAGQHSNTMFFSRASPEVLSFRVFGASYFEGEATSHCSYNEERSIPQLPRGDLHCAFSWKN